MSIIIMSPLRTWLMAASPLSIIQLFIGTTALLLHAGCVLNPSEVTEGPRWLQQYPGANTTRWSEKLVFLLIHT